MTVSVLNPGGRQSGSDTPYSASEAISEETDTLLATATQESFGIRKQAAFKTLACRNIL